MMTSQELYSIDKKSFLNETIDYKYYKSEYLQNLRLLKLESLEREKQKVPFWLRRRNFYLLMIICTVLIFSLVGALLYGIHEKTKREIHRTSVSIMLEDNIINPEEYTVTVDSRVYFSISDLCNELGITYEQIDQSKSKIVTEDNTYYLKKNSSEMEIANNDTGEIDSQLTLSKKVFEYNGRVYIYVRDLSLFMPVITKWSAENNSIFIRSYL